MRGLTGLVNGTRVLYKLANRLYVFGCCGREDLINNRTTRSGFDGRHVNAEIFIDSF